MLLTGDGEWPMKKERERERGQTPPISLRNRRETKTKTCQRGPGSHDDNYGVTADEDNRFGIEQDFLQCPPPPIYLLFFGLSRSSPTIP